MTTPAETTTLNAIEARERVARLEADIAAVVVGQPHLIRRLVTALFSAIQWPRKWRWFVRTDQLADPRFNHPGVTLEAVLVAGIDGMG